MWILLLVLSLSGISLVVGFVLGVAAMLSGYTEVLRKRFSNGEIKISKHPSTWEEL